MVFIKSGNFLTEDVGVEGETGMGEGWEEGKRLSVKQLICDV